VTVFGLVAGPLIVIWTSDVFSLAISTDSCDAFGLSTSTDSFYLSAIEIGFFYYYLLISIFCRVLENEIAIYVLNLWDL